MEFTKEEIEVVEQYLFRRIGHLEVDNLEDSYCYPKLVSFRQKLLKLKDKLDEKFTKIERD